MARNRNPKPRPAIQICWDSKTQRWRLYLRGTRQLFKNRWNLPADGGGHRTEMQAGKQAAAINHGMRQAAQTHQA